MGIRKGQGDRWMYILDQAALQEAIDRSGIPYLDIPGRAAMTRETLDKMFKGEPVRKIALLKIAGELGVCYITLIKKVLPPPRKLQKHPVERALPLTAAR